MDTAQQRPIESLPSESAASETRRRGLDVNRSNPLLLGPFDFELRQHNPAVAVPDPSLHRGLPVVKTCLGKANWQDYGWEFLRATLQFFIYLGTCFALNVVLIYAKHNNLNRAINLLLVPVLVVAASICAIVVREVCLRLAASFVGRFMRCVDGWQRGRLRWTKCSRSLIRTNQYVYTALETSSEAIRLLEILPGPKETPLRCRMREGRIGESSYEALSYCLGTSPPSWNSGTIAFRNWFTQFRKYALREQINRIRTKGRDTSQIPRESRIEIDYLDFFITHSLARALRNLRQSNGSRIVWADQLCINQSDDKEKAMQVFHMFEIYKRADRVLIWLDLNKETSSWGRDDFTSFSARVAGRESFHNDLGLSQNHVQILRSMLSSEWWKRVWIIQEVAAAREIQFEIEGSTIKWEHLEEFLRQEHVKTQMEIPTIVQHLFKRTRSIRQNLADPEYGLVSLIYEFRNSKATLDRDRIYALQHLLMSKRHEISIDIDYELLTEEIIADFFVHCIEKYHSLNVLAILEERKSGHWKHVLQNCTRVSREPLWSGGLSENTVTRITSPNAYGSQPAQCRRLRVCTTRLRVATRKHLIDISKFSLIVLRGFALDSVREKGNTFKKDDSISKQLEVLKSWERIVGKSRGVRDLEGGSSFASLITGGRERANDQDWEQLFLNRDAMFRTFVEETCSGRRCLLTAGNKIAIGHSSARYGDLVCAMFGADIPYLLRKMNHRGWGWKHSYQSCFWLGCAWAKHTDCCIQDLYELIGQVYPDHTVHSGTTEAQDFAIT